MGLNPNIASFSREFLAATLFFALVIVLISGCATMAEGQLPTVELSASAGPPVGGIIPVFITRHCDPHGFLRTSCG